MTVLRHWKVLACLLVQLAGFHSHGIYNRQDHAIQEAPIPELASPSSQCWLVADFDGDQVSDLASGRAERSGFRVDVHLSTQHANTSLGHARATAAMNLFVFDIDRDNDQDLILASFTSLSPPAVWLNDGKGHFDESDQSTDYRISDGGSSALETQGLQYEQVSIAPDDDCPFDRSFVQQIAGNLNVTDLLFLKPADTLAEARFYHFPSRSPPPLPGLLS